MFYYIARNVARDKVCYYLSEGLWSVGRPHDFQHREIRCKIEMHFRIESRIDYCSVSQIGLNDYCSGPVYRLYNRGVFIT